MPQDEPIGLEKITVELQAAPKETEERHKAGRAAQITAASAVAFLAVAVIAAIRGADGIVWTALGICVALLIVAAMLMFDSERQRRANTQDRPAARG